MILCYILRSLQLIWNNGGNPNKKVFDNMKRYISLDILRGMTVAMMIIVNNPGSWSHVYPMLRHASWDGCTPCDLVFPFFLFCVGVSMVFALAKYPGLTADAFRKVFKRGVLLYLAGLLLTAFPFYPVDRNPDLTFWQNWVQWLGELRLVGVLPRIAMCYVLGSVLVLWLKTPKKLMAATGVLCVLHVGLLLLFAGPEGAFTLEGNFARRFDLAILGENHVYHGYGIPFDPEGFLGVLTGTATVLIGYMIGLTVRKTAPVEASAKVFSLSAALLLAGLILNIWIPINKPLWSASYVFYTAGWASFVLALLIYLVDVRGFENLFFPFKALGMNALALFLLSGLLIKINWAYIGWNYSAVFGQNEFTSLIFAVLYMALHLAIAVVLYRRKIFIKL